MKWWQWTIIIVYHIVFAYAIGSQIKGAPLF